MFPLSLICIFGHFEIYSNQWGVLFSLLPAYFDSSSVWWTAASVSNWPAVHTHKTAFKAESSPYINQADILDSSWHKGFRHYKSTVTRVERNELNFFSPCFKASDSAMKMNLSLSHSLTAYCAILLLIFSVVDAGKFLMQFKQAFLWISLSASAGIREGVGDHGDKSFFFSFTPVFVNRGQEQHEEGQNHIVLMQLRAPATLLTLDRVQRLPLVLSHCSLRCNTFTNTVADFQQVVLEVPGYCVGASRRFHAPDC